jgi:hypothetical protein
LQDSDVSLVSENGSSVGDAKRNASYSLYPAINLYPQSINIRTIKDKIKKNVYGKYMDFNLEHTSHGCVQK